MRNLNVQHYRVVKGNVNTTAHPNGYPLVVLIPDWYHRRKLGLRVLAGCRNFTVAQARRHWRKQPTARADVLQWLEERFRTMTSRDWECRLHDRRK